MSWDTRGWTEDRHDADDHAYIVRRHQDSLVSRFPNVREGHFRALDFLANQCARCKELIEVSTEQYDPPPYDEADATLTCEDKCKAMLRALVKPEVTWEEYASLPAPVYEGKSAQQMIDEGECEKVLEALWRLYSGAYI